MTAVTAAQPYADELGEELPESMLEMVNGGVACLTTVCPRCHQPTLAFYARDGWECTNCHYQEAEEQQRGSPHHQMEEPLLFVLQHI